MQIVVRARKVDRTSCRVMLLLAFIGALVSVASAQSLEIASPSPIRTDEILGTIEARDIGDARLTDHFYAFTGTPGDVLITVDSNNLNGDVDVFTSSGLRPLLKFTVYAGSSSPITKSTYLRTREDLILRIEARTPNDDPGTYRIHFGGSFEPITGGPLLAENENTATQPATPGRRGTVSRTGKKGRRVSSVGARIEEPPPTEVAAAPTPEPAANNPAEAGETKETSPKATATNPRTGRSSGRRTRGSQPARKEKPAKSETEQPAEVSETKTTPARKRPTRRSTTARGVAKPTTPQEPEDSGPRLVIETSEGTLVDRYMNTVRRVTVENGQVVVVGKDGKIQRIQLANVVRMSITP